MIQAMSFGRDMFLGVFGIENSAWTQRSYRGEVALGFGLARPGHVNSYGEIDVFAMALTVFIALHVKIDMKQAAELVRDSWLAWLEGLARTERLKRSAVYSEGICFVVAANADKTKIEVAVGPCQKTMDEIGRPDMVLTPIPIDLVVRWVRIGAKKAGLSLPKQLTPGLPDSDEFKKWIAEIEAYRKFASMRGSGRKKAKVRA
jgi:hypothetical protein